MKIGVVLVTYNRLDKLKIALEKYEKQTELPKYILVVNNNSSDGTKEFLNTWKENDSLIDKYVIHLKENIGGSGGFYTGLEKAIQLDTNWIWVSDDDAFPYEDAIENATNFLIKNKEKDISAICGKVINLNHVDIKHRRRIKKSALKVKQEYVKEKEYEKEYFHVDTFSYVGTIINKEKLNKVGLTKKDYFIFYDDTEHSYRLSKEGKIICVPSIIVQHDETRSQKPICEWKDYYSIRNKLNFYKVSFEKKYYIYEYYNVLIKNYIKKIIKKILRKNAKYNEVAIIAAKDSKKETLGLHSIYKPGWKYE